MSNSIHTGDEPMHNTTTVFTAADYAEHRQDADTLRHQSHALDEALVDFISGATVLATLPDDQVDRLVATFQRFCAEMEAAVEQSRQVCQQMVERSRSGQREPLEYLVLGKD
jgi:hypothetical protein